MKRCIFVFVLILIAGCAGQLKQTPLKMADVSDKLSEFDSKPEMNFVAKAGITYATTEMNKFDDFFRKSAAVKGTIVVAKGLMEHQKNLLMNLGKEINITDFSDIKKVAEELKSKKGNIAKEKIEPLKNCVNNMLTVKDLLMGLEGKTKELISEGTNLVNIAPNELKSDPKKAMTIPKALKDSINNLEGAGKEIPELVKSFTELVDLVKPIIE